MTMLIYRETSLVARVVRAYAKDAFRVARAAVRAMASEDGATGERIEYARGRVSVACGAYRAINERRENR